MAVMLKTTVCSVGEGGPSNLSRWSLLFQILMWIEETFIHSANTECLPPHCGLGSVLIAGDTECIKHGLSCPGTHSLSFLPGHLDFQHGTLNIYFRNLFA